MKYVIDHDYHIHSHLSLCSNDPMQTAERILQYAKDYNFTSFCVTDHHWDENVPGASPWYERQDYDHISQILPLPAADGIRTLFGCETDLNMSLTLGMSPERYDNFDFIIIPTTHLHMVYNIDKNLLDTTERARIWTERLDAVLNMPLPFHKIGLAHMTCELTYPASHDGYIETMTKLRDDDMERLFSKAAKLGMGIEINAPCFNFENSETEVLLRPYKIAKACGCKFYLGSDAHFPNQLDEAIPLFKRAIDLLDLTEDDKFHAS